MKKACIITAFASAAVIVIWILSAIIYWLLTDQPRLLPKGWNIALGIPFISLVASGIGLAILERKKIISEINHLINQ